jgi:hypothetical protein
MKYTAKITDAKKMDYLADNTTVLDVAFDILLDGEVVAERRLAFPLGTSKEAITAEVKAYCQMYENDHALAAEAQKRAKDDAEADKVLDELKGIDVGEGQADQAIDPTPVDEDEE